MFWNSWQFSCARSAEIAIYVEGGKRFCFPLLKSRSNRMLIPERQSRGVGKRCERSEEVDLRVLPCSVGHGLFCEEAWAVIAKKLGLPPRQADVARRVVAGQGDKQTAEALGLSWDTVQTHMKRMYGRLNIQSRVKLATRVCAAYHTWRAEASPPTDCPENK
jgi:DNA-binding CsgD family transcriptional regulator